jgi:hypothetical protein
MDWDGLPRIDVEKSASHQQSQTEIGSDNPVINTYLETRPFPMGFNLDYSAYYDAWPDVASEVSW